MPDLFDECQDLFETDDLYEVLSVKSNCSLKEVKRAYHKLSLKVHPDRVTQKEKAAATHKFQALGKVYSVLSNEESRKLYDETGEVDNEGALSEDKDWYDYWRILFAKISVDDIKQFEKKYKGSKEELDDLKSAYTDFKGDMDLILENVLCAEIEDESRFRKIFLGLIKDGELKEYKVFTKESAKRKKERNNKAADEAAEAEKARKELGIGEGEDGLKQMILKNKNSREQQAEGFFAMLEARYAEPEKKKSKKKK